MKTVVIFPRMRWLLLIAIYCIVLQYDIYAQTKTYFDLSGMVMYKNKPLNGTIVRAYLNNIKRDSVYSTGNGRFRIKLDMNRDYTIEIKKVGYIPKKVLFSTKVPPSKENKTWSYSLVINLNEMPAGFDLSKYNEPVAKFRFSNANDGGIKEDLDVKRETTEKEQQQEWEIDDRKNMNRRIQSEIDKLSPEAKKSLGFEIKKHQLEIEADQILTKAREESRQMVEEARKYIAKDTLAKNQAITKIKAYSTADNDLEKYATRSDLSKKNTELKQHTEILSKLEKRTKKTLADSLRILESSLLVKTELVKSAKYQLEIDRLHAKTREDSILIKKREMQISSAEQEILMAKQEMENALNKVKLQEVNIKYQRVFLSFTLLAILLMLLFMIFAYRNFQNKKRVNMLLEAQNAELEKLSIVASRTENAVMIMDREGNFEWINEGFTRLFGFSLNSLLQLSKDILSFNRNEEIKEKIRHCIDSKQATTYENLLPKADGESIWVQTTLTPILDPNGEISKLVAIDSNINKIKEVEKSILQKNEEILAQKDVLELQKNEIQVQNQRMNSSLQYAYTIQQAILPSREEIERSFDMFSIYKPKDIVSGDFYWFANLPVKNGIERCIVAMIDCTGHGVPGAFMSLIGNRLLNAIVLENKIYSPNTILENLNSGVKDALKQAENENTDGMDASICLIEKKQDGNYELTFSGAKQTIYFRQKEVSNEIKSLKGDRILIGGNRLMDKEVHFTNHHALFQAGDQLYLTTDGIIDQNAPDRRRFGSVQFKEVLESCANQSMASQCSCLEAALAAHQADEEQRDDISVLSLQFR